MIELTETEIERLVALRAMGWGASRIARALHHDALPIARALRRLDLPPLRRPASGRPLTPALLAEARRLRAVNLSYTEIGRRLGICANTLIHRGGREGWPGKSAAQQQSETAGARFAPVKALLAAGLTWRQIAEQLGYTKNQVAGMVWRQGLCRQRETVPAAQRMSALVAEVHLNGCRYIAGDPRAIGPALYCGARCDGGSSWCAEHRHRVWQPTQPAAASPPARAA